MDYQNILIKKNESVQIITINRPKQLNALNKQTINELNTAILKAEKDASVRVIVITGAGEKAFIAGADIKEFASFSKEEGKKLSKEGHHKLFNFIEKLSKPVIAALLNLCILSP